MQQAGVQFEDAGAESRGAGRGIGWLRFAAFAASMTVALGIGVSAAFARSAPTKPAAHTGTATAVGYATATIRGLVDPHKLATYFYFQYGPTNAYGLQTPLTEAGAGVSAISVGAALTGLSPLTIYHYRLVAVSSAGTTFGADRSLKTTKVPLSLQIVASPNPVVFGGTITIQGTLSGTGNVDRQVVLQANAFPYTAGFVDVGNAELTSSTGGFSFPLLGISTGSQYRVVTTTQPVVISPVVSEGVSVIVTAHHAPRKRRDRVSIYGTITPAENGMHVGIMRIEHGREKLAGGAVLRSDGPDRSSYSAVIARHKGVYRVLAAITGPQGSNYSTPLLVR